MAREHIIVYTSDKKHASYSFRRANSLSRACAQSDEATRWMLRRELKVIARYLPLAPTAPRTNTPPGPPQKESELPKTPASSRALTPVTKAPARASQMCAKPSRPQKNSTATHYRRSPALPSNCSARQLDRNAHERSAAPQSREREPRCDGRTTNVPSDPKDTSMSPLRLPSPVLFWSLIAHMFAFAVSERWRVNNTSARAFIST